MWKRIKSTLFENFFNERCTKFLIVQDFTLTKSFNIVECNQLDSSFVEIEFS